MNTKQKSNFLALSWTGIYRMVKRLPEGKYFGIPRGGAVVAGILGAMDGNRIAVATPEEADHIIDDIIDSGRTREKWVKRYPHTNFIGLVDKTDPKEALQGTWLTFPWEETAERDAEDNVVRMLEFLGEDPRREGLLDTPRRVVRAWQELTVGYKQDPKQILSADFHGNGYDEMVICKDIAFQSVCEHHMLPFIGVAHVGYIPKKRVVGLSKMARLVDCFARRLQIQEKLTQQIAQAMQQVLKPIGVGVTITAKHMCMSCRGVQKDRAEMVTTSLVGAFKRHAVREEFFLHCK